jgi:hypothetical protein
LSIEGSITSRLAMRYYFNIKESRNSRRIMDAAGGAAR